MEKENDKIDLEGKILDSIKAKKIKMRPRWEFLAQKIGLESALLITFIFAAALFSLLYLYSRANEIHRLAEFGPDGWWYIMKSFPFEIFLLIGSLVYLLNLAAKKLELNYKIRPLFWYGLLALSFLVAVIIAEIGGLHKALYAFEEETDLPLLRPYIDSRIRNIVHESIEGDILESDDDKLIIQTEINHLPTTTIIRRSSFNIGHPQQILKNGDHVRIIRKPHQEKLEPWLLYKKAQPAETQ